MIVIDKKTAEKIDKETIEAGMPSILLMENAAFSIYETMKESFIFKKVVICCGKGNNGGDGYALAKLLFLRGFQVKVVICEEPSSKDCKINYDVCRSLGISLELLSEQTKNLIICCDVLVDAIFGTGFRKGMPNDIAELIKWMNDSKKPIVSVDIVSGIHADGMADEVYVCADMTVTFGFPKIAHVLLPYRQAMGRLIIKDIGFYKKNNYQSNMFFYEKKDLQHLLPKRRVVSHKGKYGKALIIAGSDEYTGAAVLTAKAALLSGCGYVYAMASKKTAVVLRGLLPEVIVKSNEAPWIDEQFLSDSWIHEADAICLGPGWGQNSSTENFLQEILKQANCPIILDADALNLAAKNINILKNTASDLILTPHPKEFSRLIGHPLSENEQENIRKLHAFAKKMKAVVLLKGSTSLCSNAGNELYLNQSGNSALSKAGTGDVLSGLITSLVAQGLKPFEACCLGTYLHGLAGEKVSQTAGLYGLRAFDLCDAIPKVMK